MKSLYSWAIIQTHHFLNGFGELTSLKFAAGACTVLPSLSLTCDAGDVLLLLDPVAKSLHRVQAIGWLLVQFGLGLGQARLRQSARVLR